MSSGSEVGEVTPGAASRAKAHRHGSRKHSPHEVHAEPHSSDSEQEMKKKKHRKVGRLCALRPPTRILLYRRIGIIGTGAYFQN